MAEADGFFPERGPAFVRGLGDGGGVVIADLRRKCRDQHQRAVHQFFDPRLIRLNAGDAIIGEADHGVGDQSNGLQQAVNHHRFEDIEFEMAIRSSNGNGGVVAHDLGADHGQGLGLRGIDFAGHDR